MYWFLLCLLVTMANCITSVMWFYKIARFYLIYWLLSAFKKGFYSTVFFCFFISTITMFLFVVLFFDGFVKIFLLGLLKFYLVKNTVDIIFIFKPFSMFLKYLYNIVAYKLWVDIKIPKPVTSNTKILEFKGVIAYRSGGTIRMQSSLCSNIALLVR